MDYAVSPTTGQQYSAWSISYDQAKALKLLCPVCKGKVYKAVRRTPQETHYFCHHMGGLPDCELYHPSGNATSCGGISTDAQGQEFQQFVKSVAMDVRTLLIAAHLARAPIDETLLESIAAEANEYVFEDAAENQDAVEQHALASLADGIAVGATEVESRLRVLIEFYRNPQARFVDTHLAIWLSYQVLQEDSLCAPAEVVAGVVDDGALFNPYAGAMLRGLALLYAQRELAEIVKPITTLRDAVLAHLRKLHSRKLKAKVDRERRTKQTSTPELPKASTLSRAPERSGESPEAARSLPESTTAVKAILARASTAGAERTGRVDWAPQASGVQRVISRGKSPRRSGLELGDDWDRDVGRVALVSLRLHQRPPTSSRRPANEQRNVRLGQSDASDRASPVSHPPSSTLSEARRSAITYERRNETAQRLKLANAQREELARKWRAAQNTVGLYQISFTSEKTYAALMREIDQLKSAIADLDVHIETLRAEIH